MIFNEKKDGNFIISEGQKLKFEKEIKKLHNQAKKYAKLKHTHRRTGALAQISLLEDILSNSKVISNDEKIKELVEIYQSDYMHETKADNLFELFYNHLNPQFQIPTIKELKEYGKKLKFDKFKFESKSKTFIVGISYSFGYAGDGYDEYYLTPFLFYWKFIVPRKKELGIETK